MSRMAAVVGRWSNWLKELRCSDRHRKSGRVSSVVHRRPFFEGLESRRTLSTTVIGNYDGIAGDDFAIVDTRKVEFRSSNSTTTRTFPILPWNTITEVDLDGQPGLELLFTNINVVGGVAQLAQATVFTARSQEVHTYDLGRPNAMQVEELNGSAGSEVLFTNVRLIAGVPQDAQATVLNQRLRQIRTYEVGKPNALQVVDLDGYSGSELLFTNLNVTGGVGQPAKASIVDSRLGQVRTYDVGRPNALQLVDLDGNSGPELLFTNVNVIAGVPQPAQATVVSSRSQSVQTYSVGQPNALQTAELDGSAGSEVLFTNLRTVAGVQQQVTATILSARNQQVSSYSAGAPNSFQIVELNGVAGNEVLFTNIDAPGGVGQPARATILNSVLKTAQSFSVGSPNAVQVVELDGVAGPEVLFTNVNVIAGVAQPARATILSGRTSRATHFELGEPRLMQIEELDGVAGSEVLFTNVNAVAGVGRTSRATILSGRTEQVKHYEVGQPNAFQILNLDSVAGSEVLFTNVNVTAGTPQTAQATIVTFRADQVRTYQVGRPSALQIAELDGEAGAELLFSGIHSLAGVPQAAQAIIVSGRNQDLQIYNVGRPDTLQLAELDGSAGQEILFTNLSVVPTGQTATATIVTARTRQATPYLVGQPNAMQLVDLDGSAGNEVLFTNVSIVAGVAQPATATILSARNSQAKNFLVGRPRQFDVVDMDGSAGAEILFTNVNVVAGVAQTASAILITGRTMQSTPFDIGQPNAMNLVDLDGSAGVEALFTNIRVLGGVAQTARATILNARTQQARSYPVGTPNALQFVELDGSSGAEVLFTNVSATGGVGQTAEATVLNGRSQQADTYQVGKPNAMQVLDLDGSAGAEVLFTNVNVIAGVIQPAQATVLTARSARVQTFDVGRPNAMQTVELDGVAGAEVLFTNISVVGGVGKNALATVLSARSQLTRTYDVGTATSMSVSELDGSAGNELVFANSNSLTIITDRSQDRTFYSVGSIGTLTTMDYDGVAGSELLVTRLDGTLGVLIHRSRRFVVVS